MALKIVSGGNEVGSPRRAPALRFPCVGPRAPVKVARRLTELYRAVDWGYVRFVLACAATAYVVVRIALERGL